MFLLFSALGFSLWRSGGRAFSPGKLSAQGSRGIALLGFNSHAEFETQCERCHQPLESTQGVLCLECHTEIAGQIEGRNGSHGAIERVGTCYRCHSDHHGPDFDMLSGALAKFDHAGTGFSLLRHQLDYDTTPMQCTACHTRDQGFFFQADACARCHADYAMDFMVRHVQDYGENCLGCHDGADRMVEFDHRATGFSLAGRHADTRCSACHTDGEFEGTPQECSRCHAEPLVHQDVFNLDCESCHDPAAWSPAELAGEAFAHTQQTGFSLVRHTQDYRGETISCQGCHGEDVQSLELSACVACHAQENPAFMQDHQDQFGSGCLDCHDGADRLSDFDHADFFPLEGQHEELACDACHVERQFRGTPVECVACHAEPQIHAGFFGLQCQYCHTAQAWVPAPLRVHPFPLDHGREVESECQVCHTGAYDEYTCYECHEHQPEEVETSHLAEGISGEQIVNCLQCHPTGLETVFEGNNE